MPDDLRVHHFLPRTRANGPGLRAALWVQGCSLGCAGCFNPATHPAAGPRAAIDEIFGWMTASDDVEGVTISGGEPFQQCRGLTRLLRRVREETDLSVLVFTGYTSEELAAMPGAAVLLDYVDVLVAGRYEQSQPFGRCLRGSANQQIHLLTDRYSTVDLDAVPTTEVVLSPSGELTVTGVDPIEVA